MRRRVEDKVAARPPEAMPQLGSPVSAPVHDEQASPAAGDDLGGQKKDPRLRRLAPVAVVVLAVAVLAAGAGLATGTLRPGLSAAGGTVRVVDEVAVTATDHRAGVSNNSPLILADPGQPRFVVMANRVDAPDFGCALQVSGDAGRSWVSAEPVPKLPEGAEKCYAPEVAFDAEGTLYYLFIGLQGGGNEPMGAFIVTSVDRAVSFSAPRKVLGPANFGVRMAIDRSLGPRGRIHLAWLRAVSDTPLGGFGPPPNPIMTAHSDDGGKSFSEPIQVSDPARERVVAPALALGLDGAVHVAYYDLGGDAIDYQGLEGSVSEEPWSVVVSSSFDGGRRFGPGRVVDDQVIAAERVMLIFTMPPPALVAGRGGLVCAAWTDARHGDADVFSRCSRDRGRPWQAPRRINDDPVGNGARQYLPGLSLSPQGRLDAVFFDRRNDPRNVFNDVYLSYSTNGGRSFTTNRKISADPSFTGIGAQYANASAKGQYEIGARLGLLSGKSRAVAAWPDTRHSQRSRTAQDLFSATLAVPEMARPSLPSRLVGAGLLVAGGAGLAAVAGARRRGRRRSEASP